uniref:Uncharacterized protein n=1 Tax=Chromera velia CCMP2878 TaxID=1169474 RepID=A0A0G4FBK3_9ALVE|eukprot:Cvel_16155.t1-p1 / transcript=Cvel_16155.t1 / gene=Cvel_16155 / organism=Chromera_velia_CCMP2878 / gene_product=hypothetical protein / transcript_product=hypothetical protein / location=Cvel_scaffold1230:47882-51276(+) / protein_length=256 / sequence_SO=supercontig / SO=protein_coding / is_pseudo=false
MRADPFRILFTSAFFNAVQGASVLNPDSSLDRERIFLEKQNTYLIDADKLLPNQEYEIKPSWLGSAHSNLFVVVQSSDEEGEGSAGRGVLDVEERAFFRTDADRVPLFEASHGLRVPFGRAPEEAIEAARGAVSGPYGALYEFRLKARLRSPPTDMKIFEEPVEFNLSLTAMPWGIHRAAFFLLFPILFVLWISYLSWKAVKGPTKVYFPPSGEESGKVKTVGGLEASMRAPAAGNPSRGWLDDISSWVDRTCVSD